MCLSAVIGNKIAQPKLFFAIVLLFASIPHIVADMYMPSLPHIASAFSATPAEIQLTLTAFMLGFSVAHLFYGPISDRFGRRQPILWGVWISIFGSLIAVFANSVEMLMLGRLLQGLGVAACNAVGRSLMRDVLEGTHLSSVGSYLGMILVFATAAAPTLGGYLETYFGWRSIFIFLFIYASIIWLISYKFLPETNSQLDRHAIKFKNIFNNYKTLFTSPTFVGYSICVCCAYAGLIAYVTTAPFLMQNLLGLTPDQFGWLSFVVGGSVFLSFFLNTRFVHQIGYEKMVLIGLLMMTIAGLCMLILASFGFLNIFVIMFTVMIFAIGAGLNFTNCFAGAFHPFPTMAGSAGGLYGGFQIFGGVAASAMMAALPESNQIPLGLVLFILGVSGLLAWKYLICKEVVSTS